MRESFSDPNLSCREVSQSFLHQDRQSGLRDSRNNFFNPPFVHARLIIKSFVITKKSSFSNSLWTELYKMNVFYILNQLIVIFVYVFLASLRANEIIWILYLMSIWSLARRWPRPVHWARNFSIFKSLRCQIAILPLHGQRLALVGKHSSSLASISFKNQKFCSWEFVAQD